MATRPAWTLSEGRVIHRDFEFPWNSGFAVSQKQKNVRGLHQAIRNATGETALEISTKSTEELGRELSAFRLTLSGLHVENVYQAAKKYEAGGPYTDLLTAEAKDAKRDPRHTSSGRLVGYVRDGFFWPAETRTAFYDYIYTAAVFERFGGGPELSPYAWFTDIEFNPARAINCQARAITICKLLMETQRLAVLADAEAWLAFHRKFVAG